MALLPNHAQEAAAHHLAGLISRLTTQARTYGPGPNFGPNKDEQNVVYLSKQPTVKAESFADGSQVKITRFTDSRGDFIRQPDGTFKDGFLWAVEIPIFAAPGDSLTLTLAGHDYQFSAPTTKTLNIPRPDGSGADQQIVDITTGTPAQQTGRGAPPQPTTPAQPVAFSQGTSGRTARAITPTDRKLVVYEAAPGIPESERLIAIDPDKAKGIGLPAFTVTNTLPTVGAVVGEGYLHTPSRQGWVWDGTTWVPVTPRAEITHWNVANSYPAGDVVIHKGVLWITDGGAAIGKEPDAGIAEWRPLSNTGMIRIPSVCDATHGLFSVPKITGAHAIATDTGSIYTYTGREWVEYYGAIVEESVTAQAAAAGAVMVGEIKMYAGNVTPPTGWVPCDGRAIPPALNQAIAILGTNVPDLTDQFIRGMDPSDPTKVAGTTHGATTAEPTGGLTVTATSAIDGKHRHTSGVTAWTGQILPGYVAPGGGKGSPTDDSWTDRRRFYTSMDGEHQHSITASASGWDAETAPQHFRALFLIYIGV